MQLFKKMISGSSFNTYVEKEEEVNEIYSTRMIQYFFIIAS